MAMLPPVGWADVATKRDLTAQLEILEHKLAARLTHEMRGWFFAIVGAFAVLLTLAETVSRLGAG